MKEPLPEKLQYAMNLSNKTREAVDRVNEWAQSHGGSVEHLSHDQVKTEVLPRLEKK